MRALSSDVRSSVRALEMGPMYSMMRLACSTGVSWSATDDRLRAAAVELHLGTGRRLVAAERGAHHAGDLELPADDADVAADGAAGADDRGELVVDRREERGARIAHEDDATLSARVHQIEDVV